MNLSSIPGLTTFIVLANLFTASICSTVYARPAVEPKERCTAVVGSAAVARAAAVLAEQQLDPTRVVIEIPRRMLLQTSPKEESWRVALRIRLDDGQVSERTELIAFDAACRYRADAVSPQF